jgi:hypothetical protein
MPMRIVFLRLLFTCALRIWQNGGAVFNAKLIAVADQSMVALSDSPDTGTNSSSSEARNTTGSGWFATANITAGSRYLVIPSSLTMGRSAASLSMCALVITTLRLRLGRGKADTELFELYVLVHCERYLAGNTSYWYPYLNSIPRSFPELPLYFPESDQALLRTLPQGGFAFTTYFNAVDMVVNTLAKFLAGSFSQKYNLTKPGPGLQDADDDSMKILKQQLRWSFAAVQSRATGAKDRTKPPCKA